MPPVTACGRARHALRTARRLSWLDWWTLTQATVWLAFARVAILLVRFPALSRRLGVPMQESTVADDDRHRAVLHRIRWGIAAVSRRAPWRCMCLEQAVAAKMMLRRRGIASTLYLGVARTEAGASIQAHAWVRCGSYYLTGGEDRGRYTEVSTFAETSSE